MTTFTDGPAKGQTLMLRRHTRFLRVVQDKDGTWDALDQPLDTPKPSETIYAYQHDIDGVRGIMCTRGKGGGCCVIGSYSLVVPQPPQELMRDRLQWIRWCESREYASRLSMDRRPENSPPQQSQQHPQDK